ncbi:F-box/kelch-repeat protein At3g06240 [Jatropha curcas]|nr:F-box/kelch-repeat protein At3g06240 [Jatropha curcas]
MSHGPLMHSLGFGFDSTIDDYKLVRLVYFHANRRCCYVVPPLAEVYSLRSGSWRMVDNDLKYVIWEYSFCAFVNGACHWLGTARNRDSIRNMIVSFDLGKEVFWEMGVPNFLVGELYIDMEVAVLDEALMLVPFARVRCLGAELVQFG